MSTIFLNAVLLTTCVLFFEAIDCFVNDLNQVDQCSVELTTLPLFDQTSTPELQPANTGGNHTKSTTHDYSTVTYTRTTTSEEASINHQPSFSSLFDEGDAAVVYPSAPHFSERAPVLPIKMASSVAKRGSEITYYPANLTTATTTVNTADSTTVVEVESSSKPVMATTVVVTPDSETVTTVETSPELGAPITLAEVKKCPPSQSLISEKDIETLVNIKVQSLGIAAALNESFFIEIISFKGKVEDDLTKFLSWFEERPTHMKHILEYLSKIRDNLQKVLTQKNEEFKEYYSLESDYNIKLDRVEKIVKKIEKYKNICKYNCDEEVKGPTRRVYQEHTFVEKRDSNTSSPTDFPPTETPANDGKYYCSKIEDLVKKIEMLLLHYLNNSKEEFKNRIAYDTNIYKAQVEELKNVSKSKALAQFGMTMYDLLNLQDQYYHFDQDLHVDVQARIRSIKTQNSNLETSITDLQYQTEKVRKYCSTCNAPIVMLRRYARAAEDEGNINNGDLVENVTLNVYTNYINQALADYQNIFSELDAFIAASKDEKIMNLKKIQEEIANMTVQETAELNKLKESLPENSIEKIINLESQTAALNQRIIVLSNELKEKYHI